MRIVNFSRRVLLKLSAPLRRRIDARSDDSIHRRGTCSFLQSQFGHEPLPLN